jgi:hypothetical protein
VSGLAVLACFKFKCKKEKKMVERKKANTGGTAFHFEYSPARKEEEPLILLLLLSRVRGTPDEMTGSTSSSRSSHF